LNFAFPIVPASLQDNVPTSLCRSSGEYSVIDGAKLTQELSAAASALGRWTVRVHAGSQALYVSSVSIVFETSSLQLFVGSSAVSSLSWTSDSALSAVLPGYLSQPQESAGGWGRNVTVSASSEIDSKCLFSYPDPLIHNISQSNFPTTGSSFMSLFGQYFSNVDSSVRCRYLQSSSVLSRWSSDSSIMCHSVSAGLQHGLIAISIEASALAQYPIPSSRFDAGSVVQTPSNASPTAATTGGIFAKMFGASFGMWDSCLRLRLKPVGSAAGATEWAHDSSISILTKRSPALLSSQSLSLTQASSVHDFGVSFVRTVASFASSLQSFAPTGSQIVVLAGSQLGEISLSVSLRIADTTAALTLWLSDSCALCKTGSGNSRSRRSSHVLISVEMLAKTSGIQYSAAAASLQSLFMSNSSANSSEAIHFAFEGRGLGVASEPGLDVFLEDNRCISTVWTSDSRIECDYVRPISRDRALLSVTINLFDMNRSTAISNDFIKNPVFVPASKPIADSFESDIFLPMPGYVQALVASYSRFGPIVTLPASSAITIDYTAFRFSEIIDADVLFYCNHTQVYLKNFVPVLVDIVGKISLVAAHNGVHINAPICFGNQHITHTLPANSFASIGRLSIALCPNITLRNVAFRLQFSVLNETGVPIDFHADSPPFDVVAESAQSLNSGLSDTVLDTEYIAGGDPLKLYHFHVTSDVSCNRLTFQYTAQLHCALANGTNSTATPFFTTFQSQRLFSVSNTSSVVRACSFNVSGWSFMFAGTCSIYVSIPTFSNVFLRSAPFLVISGDPVAAKIVGTIALQIEEADIIWSTNASGVKCLSVMLFDEFNNSVTTCQNSFGLIAIALNGTQRSSYFLYGSTIGVSDCNGIISWSSVRTSRSGSIILGLTSSHFNATLFDVINVTGQGKAVQIGVLQSNLSNTSLLLGGNKLPPVTIAMMNAVGTFTIGQSNVVIRVRVVRSSKIRCFVPFSF